MKYPIFQIFDDLDLVKSHGRINKVMSLSNSDWKNVASKLYSWYEVQDLNQSQLKESRDDSNLWIPFPDLNLTTHISNHLLLSERVIFNDLLSDFISKMIVLTSDEPIPQKSMARLALKHYDPNMERALTESETDEMEHFRANSKLLCRLIEQYYLLKDAIDEGVVIPHWRNFSFEKDELQIAHNEILKILFDDFIPNTLERVTNKQKLLEIIVEFETLLNFSFFSALEFTDKSNILSHNFALNNDFEENMFSFTARLAQAIKPDIVSAQLVPSHMKKPSLLSFNQISGLLIPSILELREKEKYAFNAFRMACQKQFEGLQSFPGTPDYDKEVKEIRRNISKELNSLDLIWDNIKRDRRRAIEKNLTTISMSVALAIVSIAQPQLSVNFFAQVVSGAGLVKGISDLLGLWQELQRKKDELRSKDFYFAWLLKNK